MPAAVCLPPKLAVRSQPELTSSRVNSLVAGQRVIVMQKHTLDDGTVRAKVGKVSEPRGVMIESLGWVTMATASEEQLRCLTTAEQHDADWRVRFDQDNLRKDLDVFAAQHNSMASRIAERRRRSRPLRKWLSYAEQGEMLMPELISRGVLSERPLPETHLHYPSLERQRDRSHSPLALTMSPSALTDGPPFPPGSFTGPAEQHEAWMTPSVLLQLAEKHYAYSRVVEARLFDSFPKRVGLIMQFSRIGQERIAALVTEVDVANDRLDKDEFRQAVRKLGGPLHGEAPERLERRLVSRVWISGEESDLLGKGCTDKELNTYFATLDNDKSGSLDVHELGRNLLSLKEAVTRKQYADGVGKVVGLHQVHNAFEEAAALCEVFAAQPPPPPPNPSARLGKLLKEKAVKIDALRTGWDPDGSGKIDKEEFATAMAGLGFECTAEELDQIFIDFDQDASSTLLVKELVTSMKRLQQEAKDQAAAEASAAGAASSALGAAEQAIKRAFKLAAAQAAYDV